MPLVEGSGRVEIAPKQMNREGVTVARCTVKRLMRRPGLRGVKRGKVVRTNASDYKAPSPLDKVNRQFRAERPNQLWCLTSRTSRPGRAGCTWPSWWTCSAIPGLERGRICLPLGLSASGMHDGLPKG